MTQLELLKDILNHRSPLLVYSIEAGVLLEMVFEFDAILYQSEFLADNKIWGEITSLEDNRFFIIGEV